MVCTEGHIHDCCSFRKGLNVKVVEEKKGVEEGVRYHTVVVVQSLVAKNSGQKRGLNFP